MTQQGFEFFEEAFDFPYPFEKYDQLYVPEYNTGAMENAGAVTLRDEYLPRSRQDAAFYEFRCSVILHEMAHMWFGDLVTMKWWDDLWLNESFAEWACYHAAVENTEFTESWTGFTNARKNWALRQDQLPSTHPIAADNYDLHAVEVNFDGITYAKGASVLKQLVAWVGLEPFLVGLRQYFKDHAYANSEFVDLLTALEKASGRELDAWAKEWLQTSGVNTLAAEFELADDGTYASFGVRQTAAGDNADAAPAPPRHRPVRRGGRPPGPSPQPRDRHRGRPDRRSTRWSARSSPTCCCSTTATSPTPRSASTSGRWPPSSNGLAAARRLAGPGAVLGRGVGHDPRRRDDGVRLRHAGAGQHRDRDRRVRRHGRSRTTPPPAINLYSHPSRRDELRARWETGVRELLMAAEPGSDHQLTFARAYAAAAHSEQAVADLDGLLDGSLVDRRARHRHRPALGAGDRPGPGRRAPTRPGSTRSSSATAPSPARSTPPRPGPRARTPRPRRAPGRTSPRTPTSPTRPTARSRVAFMRHGQEDLLEPYVEKYLEAADDIWERLGTHMASNTLEGAFPVPMGSPALVARLDQLARRVAGQPGRQALRARGPRRRGPRPRRPGQGRPGLTPSRRKQTRETRRVGANRHRNTPSRQVTTRRGLRAAGRGGCAGRGTASASMLIPRRRPRTRSPEANSVRISSDGQADLVVGEDPAYLAAGHDLQRRGPSGRP